ncbi:hypothetical protein Q1695_009007 [Nippostrongylus brasiliensis]|nr:hypothetical protein Q1695_009007 [Nippostrongylus brasiliensis]
MLPSWRHSKCSVLPVDHEDGEIGADGTRKDDEEESIVEEHPLSEVAPENLLIVVYEAGEEISEDGYEEHLSETAPEELFVVVDETGEEISEDVYVEILPPKLRRVEDIKQRPPHSAENEERKGQLEHEIIINRQTIRDLEVRIGALERLVSQGVPIGNDLEGRSMPCPFCDAIGLHYSDSCATYQLTVVSKRILRRKKKCRICLETNCPGGQYCRRPDSECRFFGAYDHNSALCELHERSAQILAEIETLRRLRDDANHRPARLRRRLRRVTEEDEKLT